MNIKHWIILSFVFSSTAFAVSGDGSGRFIGNGGGGCLCTGANNLFYSLEVIDISEAKDKKFKIAYSNENSLVQIKKRLAFYPEMQTVLLSFISKFEYEEVSPNLNMMNTFDFTSYVCQKPMSENIKPGIDLSDIDCKYEQIANYTIEGKLKISPKQWARLDETNKAALLIHEAIYQLDRNQNNAQTSDLTKKIVGLVFSEQFDKARDLIDLKFDITTAFEEFKSEIKNTIETNAHSSPEPAILELNFDIEFLKAAIRFDNLQQYKYFKHTYPIEFQNSLPQIVMEILIGGHLEMLKELSKESVFPVLNQEIFCKSIERNISRKSTQFLLFLLEDDKFKKFNFRCQEILGYTNLTRKAFYSSNYVVLKYFLDNGSEPLEFTQIYEKFMIYVLNYNLFEQFLPYVKASHEEMFSILISDFNPPFPVLSKHFNVLEIFAKAKMKPTEKNLAHIDSYIEISRKDTNLRDNINDYQNIKKLLTILMNEGVSNE